MSKNVFSSEGGGREEGGGLIQIVTSINSFLTCKQQMSSSVKNSQ